MALAESLPPHRLVLSRITSRRASEETAMEIMAETVGREIDSYSQENKLEAAIHLAKLAGEAISAAGERSDIEAALNSNPELIASAAIDGLAKLVSEFRMVESIGVAAKQ